MSFTNFIKLNQPNLYFKLIITTLVVFIICLTMMPWTQALIPGFIFGTGISLLAEILDFKDYQKNGPNCKIQ